MTNKMRIILVLGLFLAGSQAMAQGTTWEFDGVVGFCDALACSFGGVQVNDSFNGFITADTLPNSTVFPEDVTEFELNLGSLSANSQDGSVDSSTVQTDANGDFASGILVLIGTTDGFGDLLLTFDIDEGEWNIFSTFFGRIIVSGTGSWGIQTDDADSDGIPDLQDNCTLAANPDQRDTDADGLGNACDADFDQNCLVNFADLQPMRFNLFLPGDLDTDLNGDGQTNFLDLQIMKPYVFAAPGPSGIANICD